MTHMKVKIHVADGNLHYGYTCPAEEIPAQIEKLETAISTKAPVKFSGAADGSTVIVNAAFISIVEIKRAD